MSGRMRYEPTLDGLRAIAVLAVIAFHARNTTGSLNGGFLGVDVFFVLSGFLITTLLVQEKRGSGTIDIKAFYLRRLARLMPALLLFLCGYMLAAPLLFPQYGLAAHFRDAVLSGLYVSDYSKAFWDVPVFLAHTWSLSVEEHFYLLWPLTIFALCRSRNPEKILWIMFAAALAWKLASVSIEPFGEVYTRFDTRLTGLLLGGLVAFRLRRIPSDNRITPQMSIYAIGTLLFLFAVIPYRDKVAFIVGGTAAEFATALLIVALLSRRASPALQRWLAHPAMTSIGKISYGMYLWHYPIAVFVRHNVPSIPGFLIVTALSLLLASISYFTIEAMFRKPHLKSAFSA
jgi:peptidoglycan/LPS O-acetylase OafA/YrhL